MSTLSNGAVFPILNTTGKHFNWHDLRYGFGFMFTITVALIVLSFQHYLWYHVLAEFFAVGVAVIMFIVAWHTYTFSHNHYLMYLGCGYFWIACLDIAHTLLYKGMPTSLDNGNLGTQFWIFTRIFEGLLLLSAPFFLNHPLKRNIAMMVFGSLSTLCTFLILAGYMPDAYIDGVGLTPFKIIAEYIIIVILLFATGYLYHSRALIDPRILQLMLISIVLTMSAELAFTFYVHAYGLSNLIGHIFKLFSFWLIYFSIVRTTLAEPFAIMARGSNTYNAVPDPILLVDQKGIIHQANNAACQLVGLNEADLLGHHAHPLFHPMSEKEEACQLCRYIDEGKALPPTELYMGKADQWRQFTLSPIAIQEEHEATVLVSSNITKRKRAEAELHETLCTLDQKVAQRTEELNAKIQELEHTRDQLVASEKMASLGRMVAGFAHEINTPVGIAVGAVTQGQESIDAIKQLLQQEEVSETELLDHLNTVVEAENLAFNNLQRAANLVQRFKRSSVDQASLARRKFHVKEVIEDMLAGLHNLLKKTQLKIEINCPDNLNVYGSPGILEQILLNLIQNSLIHAYPDSHQKGVLRFDCKLEQGLLTLDYSDDGVGMAEQTVPRAFEPFFTTKRGKGGSGLGLYICYNLINQEGGSIECESALGKGTRFRLQLPIE